MDAKAFSQCRKFAKNEYNYFPNRFITSECVNELPVLISLYVLFSEAIPNPNHPMSICASIPYLSFNFCIMLCLVISLSPGMCVPSPEGFGVMAECSSTISLCVPPATFSNSISLIFPFSNFFIMFSSSHLLCCFCFLFFISPKTAKCYDSFKIFSFFFQTPYAPG